MTPKATKLDPATLTAEEVRDALDYDPQTGVLTWRPRPRDQFQFEHAFVRFNEDRVGQRAGKRHAQGTVVGLKLVQFPAEQLAWLHAHGAWPDRDIEFVDGDPNNCALANLCEGELPFVAGTNGAAHKRRAKAPPKTSPKATTQRSQPQQHVDVGDVWKAASEHLKGQGMEQGDRRRMLREVADLL
jgi:hypothetical protein